MQLNLDKRYFGEYIPPERCECDCQASFRHRRRHYHSGICATKTGKYWVDVSTAVTADEQILFALENFFKTTLSKHPMFVFLKNHGLIHQSATHGDNIRGYKNPLKQSLELYRICYSPKFDALIADNLFIDSNHHADVFDINLCLFKDETTGRVYLKAVRSSHYWDYTSSSYYQRLRFFGKITNPNLYTKHYDIKPIGIKQAWLDTMKIFSLYTTASKVIVSDIVSDVVNEIAPQFFKEQA